MKWADPLCKERKRTEVSSFLQSWDKDVTLNVVRGTTAEHRIPGAIVSKTRSLFQGRISKQTQQLLLLI